MAFGNRSLPWLDDFDCRFSIDPGLCFAHLAYILAQLEQSQAGTAEQRASRCTQPARLLLPKPDPRVLVNHIDKNMEVEFYAGIGDNTDPPLATVATLNFATFTLAVFERHMNSDGNAMELCALLAVVGSFDLPLNLHCASYETSGQT